MVFSSNVFLFIFLPVVLGLYFISPKKMKNNVLLLASLFFYFWGGAGYFFVMLLSIALNYFSGIGIYAAQRRKNDLLKKMVLCFSVIGNLGILFYFKYLDFSITIFNDLFHTAIPLRDIVLPIGISFFTFQGMTYVIDYYRGEVEVQKNILNVALYISLFPQLVAGPIVRYKDVNSQIESRSVTIDLFSSGVQRFMLGLGKKVLLANTMAVIADNIFNSADYSGLLASTAWLGIICYTLQIYFDFGGYSDMAIGLGRMFGFEFKENFNLPYISRSITEFWRRWHISLSSFFRDYLYIPLGGNRKGNVYVNLFIVFLATGLWHGASLNFVLWGIYHGGFMLIERICKKHYRIRDGKLFSFFSHIYTILVVMVGWVLFRADTLSKAVEYLGRMFSLEKIGQPIFSASYYLNGFSIAILIIGIIASTKIPRVIHTKIKEWIRPQIYEIIKLVVFICYSLFVFIRVLTSTYNPFIYFRF